MFEEREHALRLHTFGKVSRHYTGKIAVFGIILEVTSRERSSVNVYAGSVDTVVTHPSAFFAHMFALLFNEFFVKRCSNDTRRYVVASCRAVAVYLTNESERTVGVNTFGNTQNVEFLRPELTVFNEVHKLLNGKLVKERLPPCAFVAVFIVRLYVLKRHKTNNVLILFGELFCSLSRLFIVCNVPRLVLIIFGTVGVCVGSNAVFQETCKRGRNFLFFGGRFSGEGSLEVSSRHFVDASAFYTCGNVVKLVVVTVGFAVDIHFIFITVCKR